MLQVFIITGRNLSNIRYADGNVLIEDIEINLPEFIKECIKGKHVENTKYQYHKKESIYGREQEVKPNLKAMNWRC